MSKTIRLYKGDFFVDENIGKTSYIDGPGKMMQDLIEEFLTEYDSSTNRGTKIRKINNIDLLRQEIAETVDRFKERQRTNPAIISREQIDEITRLIIKSYNGTDVIFYLEVSTVSKDREQMTLIKNQANELINVEHQIYGV